MSEFNAQKLRSARRNSGLPPNQPRASRRASRRIGQSPAYGDAICPEILATQADTMSGESPSRRQGATSISSQAVSSLGRLISERRLPASESSDRLLVLDASSSMSP